MKLDFECLESVLKEAEHQCDGFNCVNLSLDLEKPDEGKRAYHYKLAKEQNLIEWTITEVGNGKSDRYGDMLVLGPGKTISVEISVSSLTMQGQQILEAMQNKGI